MTKIKVFRKYLNEYQMPDMSGWIAGVFVCISEYYTKFSSI